MCHSLGYVGPVATMLLGFVVAAAVGLCGVGAGVLTAPALILWFDVPPPVAVGTALAFGTLIKAPAIAAYARRGLVDLRTAGTMVLFGLPGVLAGALALRAAGADAARGPVLVAVGIVVAAAATVSLLRGRASPPAPAPPARRALAWCLPIGFEVGFSSAGAGALGTLLLLRATPLAPAAVVGTDLVFGGVLSAAGSAVHAAAGGVDPDRLWRLCAGGLAGAVTGAHLASRLPAARLRTALLALVAALGVRMALEGLRLGARPTPAGTATGDHRGRGRAPSKISMAPRPGLPRAQGSSNVPAARRRAAGHPQAPAPTRPCRAEHFFLGRIS